MSKSSKTKSKASRPAFGSNPSGTFQGSGFGGFGGSSSQSSLSYLAEPPAFTSISDPNVVVSFKNVLKKDSTTKAKALEELLSYVQAHPHDQDGGVEEPILDVWTQLYPRTSIDNSRRVRELSHNLQFELMKSARKRMERHIPTVVGAWLAGLYDRDRVVARAANDGLSSFLNTPEKVLGFWKKCQAQILDFSIEGIQETKDTLSDERSTTSEDSEAKYFRVVTASLSLVLGLLQKVGDEDIAKAQDKYDAFFAEDDVWKGITYNDASVRKTVCHLVFVCLDRKLPCAEETKVRQAIVTGGLKTNQAGSALEYVRALTKLSQANPDIWTAGEKKSSFARLQSFIAKGSQGSPPKFWEHLDQLLNLIPSNILTLENSLSLLTSLKSGVTNREEPRTNTSFAWKCYMDTAQRLLKSLSAEDKLHLGKEQLFPLFEQFLFSVSERNTSIPVGVNAMSVFVQAYIALATSEPPLSTASAEEWERLASIFSANISASLPEISKEFSSSQGKIGEEGRRWFGLVGQIHEKTSNLEGAVPDHTTAPSEKVLAQSVSLLESRNLKPFGCSQIIEFALSTSPHLFGSNGWGRINTFLTNAASGGISNVVESPSSKYLLSCVRLLGTLPAADTEGDSYRELWHTWTANTLKLNDESARNTTLASLISHDKGASFSRSDGDVQKAIYEQSIASAKGQGDAWDLLEASVTYHALGDDTYQKLAKELVTLFETQPQSTSGILRALEILVKGRPQLFSINDDLHTTLVAQLLSLSELSDTSVSEKSRSIRGLLDSHAEGKLPIVGIIQSNLDRAGPQSLGIGTVASQAENATGVPLEELFPSTNVWMEQLAVFLHQPMNPALSITSNIGGAALVLPNDRSTPNPQISRDRKGRSVPVRMALYLNRILEGKLDVSTLPEQFQVELLCLQCITAQLVSDQITTMDVHGPYESLFEREAAREAEDLVSFAQGYLNTLIVNPGSPAPLLLLDLLVEQSKNATTSGHYAARALCELISSIVEAQGLSLQLEETLLKADVLKASPETVLVAAATVSGIGEAGQGSKAFQNFTNRLVSDVAGASSGSSKTHATLVLLTLCAQAYERGELPVANNRIVFAVRQITSWLDEPDFSPSFSAEVCRALAALLPCMKDVYGSYWEATLEFCVSLWQTVATLDLHDALPIIHASLKLVRMLETLSEPNDDLEDALKETSNAKSKALIELLKLPRPTSSQPLEIVDSMICREVEKIPLRLYPDLGDIFPLVATQSRDVQTAAFNLLHRAIPAQQEQKSVDVLLDKTGKPTTNLFLSLSLQLQMHDYPTNYFLYSSTPQLSKLIPMKPSRSSPLPFAAIFWHGNSSSMPTLRLPSRSATTSQSTSSLTTVSLPC